LNQKDPSQGFEPSTIASFIQRDLRPTTFLKTPQIKNEKM